MQTSTEELHGYVLTGGSLFWAGLVGGLILSLIWMILLRFSAGLMAWFVILAVNAAFAACTILAFTKVHVLPFVSLIVVCGLNMHDKPRDDLTQCWHYIQAGMLGNFGAVGMYVRDQVPFSEDPSAQDRKIWQICAYVAVGLTGLLIIFTLVIIRRVKATTLPSSPYPCMDGLNPETCISTSSALGLYSEPEVAALHRWRWHASRWLARQWPPCPHFSSGRWCHFWRSAAWLCTGWQSRLSCTAQETSSLLN